MNKKSVIVGFIGIIIICLVTTGCLFYNVLDSDDFKKNFQDLGYTITDNNEPKYDADTSLVASKGDSYNIEYYEFKNETEAKIAYQNYKKNISSYITADAQNNETTGAVFSKMLTESPNEFIAVSRVKNTLIFIKSTPNEKNNIINLLKDIRY